MHLNSMEPDLMHKLILLIFMFFYLPGSFVYALPPTSLNDIPATVQVINKAAQKACISRPLNQMSDVDIATCLDSYLVSTPKSDWGIVKRFALRVINDSEFDKTSQTSKVAGLKLSAKFMAYLALGQNKEAKLYLNTMLSKNDGSFSYASKVTGSAFLILNDMHITNKAAKKSLYKYGIRSNEELKITDINGLFLTAWNDIFESAVALQDSDLPEVIRIRKKWDQFRERPLVKFGEFLSTNLGVFSYEKAMLECLSAYGSGIMGDYKFSRKSALRCIEQIGKLKKPELKEAGYFAYGFMEKNLKAKTNLDLMPEETRPNSNKFDKIHKIDPYLPMALLFYRAFSNNTEANISSRDAAPSMCSSALNSAYQDSTLWTPKDLLADTLFNIAICFNKNDTISKAHRNKYNTLRSYLADTYVSNFWKVGYADAVFNRSNNKKRQNLILKEIKRGLSSKDSDDVSVFTVAGNKKDLSRVVDLYLTSVVKKNNCRNARAVNNLILDLKTSIYSSGGKSFSGIPTGAALVNLYEINGELINIYQTKQKTRVLSCFRLIPESLLSKNDSIKTKTDGELLTSVIDPKSRLNLRGVKRLYISPHRSLFNIPWLMLAREGKYLVEDYDIYAVVNDYSLQNRSITPINKTGTTLHDGHFTDFGAVISLIAHGVNYNNFFDFRVELDNGKELTQEDVLSLVRDAKASIFVGCGFGQTSRKYKDKNDNDDIWIYKNEITDNVAIYQQILKSGVNQIIVTVDGDLPKPYEKEVYSKFLKTLKSGRGFSDSLFETVREQIGVYNFQSPMWRTFMIVQ